MVINSFGAIWAQQGNMIIGIGTPTIISSLWEDESHIYSEDCSFLQCEDGTYEVGRLANMQAISSKLSEEDIESLLADGLIRGQADIQILVEMHLRRKNAANSTSISTDFNYSDTTSSLNSSLILMKKIDNNAFKWLLNNCCAPMLKFKVASIASLVIEGQNYYDGLRTS